MPYDKSITIIDANCAIQAVSAALKKIDSRLVNHGERVAFIACSLCDYGRLKLDKKIAFLLSLFHDVGAYKTEEIDNMLEFETRHVWNHSIYGYLFLSHMSPLGEYAQAILYHHSSWQEIQKVERPYRDYAALIYLADRMDIAMEKGENSPEFARLLANKSGLFAPEYIDILRKNYKKYALVEKLADGTYHDYARNIYNEFSTTTDEALAYLKMIVLAIDFRSRFTVTHSINTISISVYIARNFGLDQTTLEKIYLGSLLHDVGKVAIPSNILEYPGKLSTEQMEIMKTHVSETEKLIAGIVPDEILNIAARHHEKLDGSGYPYGLKADELTFPERIVAVADIISALSSTRSYKEPFHKEKVIQILSSMAPQQLDESICNYVCANYDEIIESTASARDRVIREYQDISEKYMALNKRFLMDEGMTGA